jgi:Fe-S cluster assembly protein SufD
LASAVPTGVAEPEWLAARRSHAAEAAERLELPDTKSPGWEFTDLSGLDLEAFPPEEPATEAEGHDPLFPSEGRDSAPRGATVMPLDVAAAEHSDLVREHFGAVVSADDPFVARNEAAWSGGVFVHVPRGVVLDAPVLLTAVQEADGHSLNRRVLIVLEEGAEAEVWEQYLSAREDVGGLLNAVVEIRVGPGARLRYVCGQGLSERSWIFGTQRAVVDRDGSLEWVALGLGSARGKVRMETQLAGPGAEGRVTGAYIGHGRQHLDFDTTQEHAAPNTTSDLAFRGLLDGRATAVWRGMIKVDKGAQQTDAFQESRNLLLSKRSHADAIPGLEIEANDVRCTHAAAVAQIDADQLFYLRARGIPEPLAKRLIIEGFMQALVERFPAGAVHDAVSEALDQRLGRVLGRV